MRDRDSLYAFLPTEDDRPDLKVASNRTSFGTSGVSRIGFLRCDVVADRTAESNRRSGLG